VQVFVDKKGHVEGTIILKGLTPELNQAAKDAIRKTRFKPAKQQGRDVGVWISIPVNFRLGGTTSTWNSGEVEKNSGGGVYEGENIVLITMVLGLIFTFLLIQ